MGERFVDRVVLVTGGGSGLGEAMAVAFAREGARVGVLDIDGEAAARVADRVGGRAYPGDVSDESTVIEKFAAVDRDLGAVDVLVSNAGSRRTAPSSRSGRLPP